MSETTSADGSKFTSVTTRKTTLKNASADGVTVDVETAVEVSGAPVETAPQTLHLTYDDLPAAEMSNVHRSVLGPGSVEISGTPQRVTIHQIEISDSATKTVIKRFYSADTIPHVLKSETIKTDRKSDAVLAQTVSQIIALDVPYPLLGKMYSVALGEEVHKHAGGSIRRLVLHSADVPGGLVGESTKELDVEGHVIRRSTLEVIESSGK